MRRRIFAFVVLALTAVSSPVAAQTEIGEFNYSPDEQLRGRAISISGRCSNGGDTTLRVTVQEGAAGDGNFSFSKAFPSNGNAVSGTMDVPDDAPYGPYVITGECFPGSSQQAFFRKDGTFSVVERLGATTTTQVSTGSATTTSSTTSTTVDGATPSTTEVELTEQPDTFEETPDTTDTTIDEFAGTRNEDDDSIGPLILLIGIVPLALAVGAIAIALRRGRAATPE